MRIKSSISSLTTIAVLSLATANVAADSARDQAIKSGARQLNADEIARLVVGKTVTAQSGHKKFLFYYGNDNVLRGKLLGGNWSDTGYYGITDDDRICVSVTKDKGRLRCLSLFSLNGTVRKYNIQGKMTFELLDYRDGNQL